MVSVALMVRLEAKPGEEAEIFDAFPDEAGRQAHLSGKVAPALMARASEFRVIA